MRSLHVHRIGVPDRDQPIVALHGIRGWGGRWNAVPGLSAYAPDLRGHGRSPRTGPWGIDQHVADVLDVLDALGLERVRLLGISFGGLIAHHLALAAPERVARLVLLDPAMEVDEQTAESLRSAVRPVPTFRDVDEAYSARARIWPQADHGLIAREIEQHLEKDAAGRWRWCYEAEAIEDAFTQMAQPAPTVLPEVPAALVIAARGSLVGLDFSERWRAGGKEIETIETTHSMEIDNPRLVAEAVTRLFATSLTTTVDQGSVCHPGFH